MRQTKINEIKITFKGDPFEKAVEVVGLFDRRLAARTGNKGQEAPSRALKQKPRLGGAGAFAISHHRPSP